MSSILGTIHRDTGLYIGVADPIWWNPRRGFIESLSDEISSINSMSINAIGGYDVLDVIIILTSEQAQDYFENGLGRDVRVYDAAKDLVWEGFINEIYIQVGSVTAVVGPMMDITNRALVIYTPLLDASVEPPLIGSESETTLEDDTESQRLYGILEGNVSGGTLTDDEAVQLRTTYLQESKDPKGNKTVAIGQTEGGFSVNLRIYGYKYFLEKYIYNSSTLGYQTISAKIQAVMGGDPNGIFSTDYTGIETNAFLTAAQDRNRFAWSIIKSLVSIGDINDLRFLVGIYAEQKIHYSAIPSEITYISRIEENQIEDTKGQIVDPWDVLPGKWLFFSDFFPGRDMPRDLAGLRDDPRAMFIESTSFASPMDLQLNGVRISTLGQKMVKMGLGEMG